MYHLELLLSVYMNFIITHTIERQYLKQREVFFYFQQQDSNVFCDVDDIHLQSNENEMRKAYITWFVEKGKI